MARDGADAVDVAEHVMRGVEIDIRRNNGAPAFPVAVDLLLLTCNGANGTQRLLDGVAAIRKSFGDSPFSRHLADATEKIGLSAIDAGTPLSRGDAERMLLVRVATSRCCDGMIGYVARNRNNNISASEAVIEAIKSRLGQTDAVYDLAERMRNCTSKGIPARAAKRTLVTHSASSLNDEEL